MTIRLFALLFEALTGCVLFFVPRMSRREVLFAVPGPPDFRTRPEGEQAVAEYHRFVLLAIVVVILLAALLPERELPLAMPLLPLIMVGVATAAYAREHGRLKRFAVEQPTVREVELSDAPERLPGFAWLAAGPFLILGGAAAFVAANWNSIPARVAVHFDFQGHPNRWIDKSVHGVFGPLLFGAALCVWLLAIGAVTWYGSRRSPQRRTVLAVMIGVEFILAAVFSLVAIMFVHYLPPWVFAVGIPVVIIPFVIWAVTRGNEPAGPPEVTPLGCWRAGGLVYVNPDDPVLFVQKRDGMGYTFNFGNRLTWILLPAIVLIFAGAMAVLSFAMK